MGDRFIHLPTWDQLPDIGLYMDQIMTLVDRSFPEDMPRGVLTKAMINNYVKAGLLPRPNGRIYGREHLARLQMIVILKHALSMESIQILLRDLCAEGVQTGYDRFCHMVEEMVTAAVNGSIGLDFGEEPKEGLALRYGLMAALCTIQTYRLLSDRKQQD